MRPHGRFSRLCCLEQKVLLKSLLVDEKGPRVFNTLHTGGHRVSEILRRGAPHQCHTQGCRHQHPHTHVSNSLSRANLHRTLMTIRPQINDCDPGRAGRADHARMRPRAQTHNARRTSHIPVSRTASIRNSCHRRSRDHPIAAMPRPGSCLTLHSPSWNGNTSAEPTNRCLRLETHTLADSATIMAPLLAAARKC